MAAGGTNPADRKKLSEGYGLLGSEHRMLTIISFLLY